LRGLFSFGLLVRGVRGVIGGLIRGIALIPAVQKVQTYNAAYNEDCGFMLLVKSFHYSSQINSL
jgi:hypothetical protein